VNAVLGWRAPAGRWRALASSTTGVVIAAGVLIAAIALVDRRVNLSFRLLDLFPIILIGTVLPRWLVVLVASLCTWLTGLFNPFPLRTESETTCGGYGSLAWDGCVRHVWRATRPPRHR